MISSLFCMMVVVVASAAVGREVSEELRRIREGERPPDDEIRQEWDAVLAEARSRWDAFREQIERRRRGEPEPVAAGRGPGSARRPGRVGQDAPATGHISPPESVIRSMAPNRSAPATRWRCER